MAFLVGIVNVRNIGENEWLVDKHDKIPEMGEIKGYKYFRDIPNHTLTGN